MSAAAVAAVHRCGRVLQVGESCHSVWGAAAPKLLFSSAIFPSSESHWYFLVWCLPLPAVSAHFFACQGVVSNFFFFKVVRNEGLALIFRSISAVFSSSLISLLCAKIPTKTGIPLSSPDHPLHTQALSCLSRSPASKCFLITSGHEFSC